MIKEYIKKDGSKAYMFVAYLGTDPLTGKQKRTTRRGFKTKREAKIAEAKLQTEVKENGFKTTNKYTFEDVYYLWLRQYKNTVKESTLNRVQNNFKTILKKFRGYNISKINHIYCQEVIDEWVEKYKSARNLLQLTGEIFKYAIKLDIINKNPMDLVSIPRKEIEIKDDKILYYTKTELEEFLDACKENLMTYCIFRVLAFSGMRQGELLALQWKDVDFNNNTISINRTRSNGMNNSAIIQTPKTNTSIRTVVMDEITMEVLADWRKEQTTRLFKLGFNTLNKEQFLFTTTTNEMLSPIRLYNMKNSICKKNNIKNIKVHGFRHTHCSLLLAAGVPIQDVQKRLGHSDMKTTLNIYTHITSKQHESAVNKLMDYVNF